MTMMKMLCGLSLSMSLSAAAVAQALNSEYSLDINGQSLSAALKEFSLQTGLQVGYVPASKEEERTTVGPLKGRFTAELALGQLLGPSGLSFVRLNDRTIAVVHRKPAEVDNTDSQKGAAAQTKLENDDDIWGRFLLAQTASPPGTMTAGSADAQADSVRLEEVIVSARRREEKIQTVPIAITAISQQTLQDNNVVTLGELQYLVPSMSVSTPLYSRDSVNVSIRGQGSNRVGGEPGVVAYVNEVPIPSINDGELSGGPGLLFDLENVQVLKGPQGTLFGKNSVGGAILLQTARPTEEFGGRIQVGYGNYNNREIDAAINLPIVPQTLLARFAFNGDKRDGFTHLQGSPSYPNGVDIDNRDYWSVRGTVTFKPADRFQNDLIATYQEYDSLNSPRVLTAVNPTGPFPSAIPLVMTLAEQQLAVGIRTVIPIGVDPLSRGSLLSVNNITRAELSDTLTFRNILGYNKAKSVRAIDEDATVLPLFDSIAVPSYNTVRQFTEEAQLLGKSFDERFDWIVGAFYLRSENPDYQFTRQVFVFTPTDTESKNETNSKALFAQGTYDLSDWAAGLSVTAGLRYTWDERLDRIRGGFSGSSVCIAPKVNCDDNPDQRTKSSALTWTFGADYKLSPDALLYLASRRGYRPGGSNGRDGLGNPYPDFDPEYATDFELGLKSDWMMADIPVRTNVAVYYQNYTDIQVDRIFFDTVTNSFPTITDNAAKARQWGAELEMQMKLFDDLQLGVNFNYLDFKYTRLEPGVDPIPLRGTVKTNRPPYKYGVNARYRLPLTAELGNVSLQANWNWQDTSGYRLQPGDPLQVGGYIPAFGLLNVSANWDGIGGSPVDLSLFASNVLDKEYSVGGLGAYYAAGFNIERFGEPRMYGIRLRYRFGAETN